MTRRVWHTREHVGIGAMIIPHVAAACNFAAQYFGDRPPLVGEASSWRRALIKDAKHKIPKSGGRGRWRFIPHRRRIFGFCVPVLDAGPPPLTVQPEKVEGWSSVDGRWLKRGG